MKSFSFSRVCLILLALLLPVIPGAAPAPTRELQWESHDGIWVFTLRFDHTPTIQATDQHVEMGYFYLDCAGESGPAAQTDWPIKAAQITQVRRVYYGRQHVLRYIFYVPRGSQVRIDKSMADARTCVVTISPLVATTLAPSYRGQGLPRKMVVIDPGHGGWPTQPGIQEGAQTARRYNGQVYHEKDITLKIGQYLERYVKQSPNMEPFMTRRADVYVSLDRRIELANQARGDLFISIHLNATSGRNKSARGFEIYYLTNEDRAVNRQLVAMENDEKKVELDTRDSSGETLRELLRLLANEKFPQVQAASRDLCTVISEQFRAAGPFRGYVRGIKAEPFRVLLNFNMPAALAECGFLDNDADARLLIQPAVQQQIAALLFNGINRYFATVDPNFKPHMVQVAK